MAEYNIPGYILFVNHGIRRGVTTYAHVSLYAQLLNALSNGAFGVSIWCHFITLNDTKVLLGFICKSPNTTEQNEKVLFSLLELANKSMGVNDTICIMRNLNYPSIK